MISQDLSEFFDERLSEINEYMDFLQSVEDAAQSGPPRIEGSDSLISVPQQKILYSSVYLQLYNLVEATVTRCLASLSEAATEGTRWKAEDLNDSLRNEWVRSTARTHVVLTPEHRLEHALTMCDQIIAALPIELMEIEVGGGGNWDDDAIEKISKRVGCDLRISRKTKAAAKRHRRDGLGALKLVRKLRNRLAHGSISFVECADEETVSDIRMVVDAVAAYLAEAVASFGSYLDAYDFLIPDRKPA